MRGAAVPAGKPLIAVEAKAALLPVCHLGGGQALQR